MTSPEAVTQLARLLGREEAHRVLGPEPYAAPPTREQVDALRRLVDRHLDRLVHGLAEEAVASDDVTSRADAEAYLEERLAFFAGVLTVKQAARIREAYRTYSGRWG